MSKYLNFGCHPHPLTQVWFKCALCLCHGYSSFYRCPECSTYQIHDSCAEAPDSISFFGHAQHPLALEQATPGGLGRCCDICLYCIPGIHYGCRACGFFLHPVCAKLPPSTISPVHPQHLLTLVPGKGSIYNWKCKDCEDEYDVRCMRCPAPPMVPARPRRRQHEPEECSSGHSRLINLTFHSCGSGFAGGAVGHA